MADLKAVFAQFANSASEGEAACLDKKKVKRALKVIDYLTVYSCNSNICFYSRENSYTKADNIFDFRLLESARILMLMTFLTKWMLTRMVPLI